MFIAIPCIHAGSSICCSGFSSKRILLKRYLSSSTSRAPSLRMTALDKRYLHGLKAPITTKTKPFVFKCLNGSSTRIPGYEDGMVLNNTQNHSEKIVDEAIYSYSALKLSPGEVGADVRVHQEGAVEQKRYAKMHYFCFGIPYGGFWFGGLFGFLSQETLQV